MSPDVSPRAVSGPACGNLQQSFPPLSRVSTLAHGPLGWPLLPSAPGEPDTYPLPSLYTERVPEKFDCRSHNQGEPLPINHSSLPCPGLDSHVPDTSWPSDALWDLFRAFTSLPCQKQHYLASLYHTDVCFPTRVCFLQTFSQVCRRYRVEHGTSWP